MCRVFLTIAAPEPRKRFSFPSSSDYVSNSSTLSLCAFLSYILRTKYWCRIIEERLLGFFPLGQICTNCRRAISPRCQPKTNWCDGPPTTIYFGNFFSLLPTRFRCYFLFFFPRIFFLPHSHLVAGGRVSSCQWWLQRAAATPRPSCTCCKSPPTK